MSGRLAQREPNFDDFLKVLWRKGRPSRLPFYEHLVTVPFLAESLGMPLDRIEVGSADYWRLEVDFWMRLGFDGVVAESPPLNKHTGARAVKTSDSRDGARGVQSEARRSIADWDDFEQFQWADVSAPINFFRFEEIAKHLPDGAKMIAGVGGGPYEWSTYILGVQGLSLLLYEYPDLVAAVYDKLGDIYESGVRQLASMDEVGALRQGDDLGFKTATFLPPDALRQYVLPIYKRMAAAAHEAGKPFILHSCGQLEAVYDDLIDFCKIDAKHSFEDVITPVAEFKAKYGARITPLGGLDVDFLCRAGQDEIRAYTRKAVEDCFQDGHWAIGTGNSLTDYLPVQNYITVLKEAASMA